MLPASTWYFSFQTQVLVDGLSQSLECCLWDKTFIWRPQSKPSMLALKHNLYLTVSGMMQNILGTSRLWIVCTCLVTIIELFEPNNTMMPASELNAYISCCPLAAYQTFILILVTQKFKHPKIGVCFARFNQKRSVLTDMVVSSWMVRVCGRVVETAGTYSWPIWL